MERGTTHVVLDDSKRQIVAGILRPESTQPELRELSGTPSYELVCFMLNQDVAVDDPLLDIESALFARPACVRP